MKRKKQLLKRIGYIALPLVAVMATIGAIYVSTLGRVNNPLPLEVEGSSNSRRVYLLSNDDLVVPLTVSTPVKEDLAEELLELVSLMGSTSPLIEKGFRPVLPEGACVKAMSVVDRLIKVDFCQSFATYKASDELRILEALVWNFTQYPSIDAVELMMEGETLPVMPVAATPLVGVLTRSIGINNVATSANNPYRATRVVTYYQRRIGSQLVLIPLTRRVSLLDDHFSTMVAHVFNSTCDIVGFSKPDFLKKVQPTSPPSITDDTLTIDLNRHALEDEGAVSKEIFDYLFVSFIEVGVTSRMVISVEGEPIQISGYDVEFNEIEVSFVIYNGVQL